MYPANFLQTVVSRISWKRECEGVKNDEIVEREVGEDEEGVVEDEKGGDVGEMEGVEEGE